MISKSQYLKGLQCPKALWLYRNRKDLAPVIGEGLQFIFDMGHEVGELARQYFGEGIEIAEPYYAIKQAIQSTNKAVRQGADVIFEATACSDSGAYSRIDILKKVAGSDTWDLIEVKSSTEVKDYHLDDMALQRHAFTGGGYRIRKSILMHIKNRSVRSGQLDLQGLFTLEDCTEIVKDRLTEVDANVADLIEILNYRQEPEIEIGGHCTNPFECDYIPYCWDHIPDYSVYDIFAGSKLARLLGDNILDISEVPEDFDLTDRQAIEISAHKSNKIHCDTAEIKAFLARLNYPLYYLDYETISTAVPLFDNSSPYETIPFQFSLHIQSNKGGDLEHIDFLHTGPNDPRPDFLEALVNACRKEGSVVVYNQPFESGVNNGLALKFPAYAASLAEINHRMIDLLVPFRRRHLYHPQMTGSASLKSVLPAFVPDLTYEGLAISNGEMASITYNRCIRGLVPEQEKQQIFEDLRAYCKLDTLAEVKLVEVLYHYSEKPVELL
ncbi:MAG: DUF2779 domain-containing protein [Desulfobacterales bacterium]